MTATATPAALPPPAREAPPGRRRRGVRVVGRLFLWTSGIHVGIVAADAQTYGAFADGAWAPVRRAWADVFMAAPAFWGLAVAAGELLIGLLVLAGGRWTRLGLLGVVGFHLCLLLFGWGIWFYALPALALLVPLAAREWHRG